MTAEKWADNHLLSAGDLLFARSGATVGKTYLHDTSFDPAVFAGYCIRFRFAAELLPEFAYGFTKTDIYASWVATIQRPAGQPNINKEEFKSLEIPVPPGDVQRRLVAELDNARAARDRALTEAALLLGSIDEIVKEKLKLPEVELPRQCGYAIRLSTFKQNRTLSANYFHPERMAAIQAIRGVPNASLSQLVAFKRTIARVSDEVRWDRDRRVVIKAEVVRLGDREPRDNPRFVVTNLRQTPRFLYERIYCARGDIENRIKELLDGLQIDRTSCCRFWANQLRVLLTAAAYVLMQELRLRAARTACARAQVTWLRDRLLKLGAHVVGSVRRVVLHLPTATPDLHAWRHIALALGARAG